MNPASYLYFSVERPGQPAVVSDPSLPFRRGNGQTQVLTLEDKSMPFAQGMNEYKCMSARFSIRHKCTCSRLHSDIHCLILFVCALQSPDGFERLSSKLSCYPGLEDRYDPRYFFCRMMRQRTVRFLNGNADRGVGDDRPEAMAQGANLPKPACLLALDACCHVLTPNLAWIGADRIERAIHYQHHLEQMQARFGLAAVQNCTLHWIPNVKHDGRTM